MSFSIPEFEACSIGCRADVITDLEFLNILGDPIKPPFFFRSNTVTLRFCTGLVNSSGLYLAGNRILCYMLISFLESRQNFTRVLHMCSFTPISISLLHPHFWNPLISFSLDFVGVSDKILKEKKPFLFILSVRLSANMQTSLSVLYDDHSHVYVIGFLRYVTVSSGKIRFPCQYRQKQ